MQMFTAEAWIAMLIPAVVLSVTLTVVFNIKSEKTSETTKIFNILLHSNMYSMLVLVIAMLMVNNFKITNWIPQLLVRLFLVGNDLFMAFVGIYLMSLFHLQLKRNKNFFDKAYRKHLIMIILIAFIQIWLPVDLTNCNFTGLGSQFASGFFVLNVIFWIMLLIKYRKKITINLIIQAIFLLIIGGLGMITSQHFDDSHVVPLLEFFVIFVIYLRAENPDIKYITELNKNKAETEKALSAKNDFLNSMSDELSDPLNKIVQCSNEMYTFKDQTIEPIQEDLDYLVPTAKNLYEIVGNIIDINKIENNQITINEAPYNPVKTIESVVESEKVKITNKDIQIEFEYDNSIPVELTGDEVHVKQIVHNLIDNAIKYTEKGTVKIIVAADQINYDTYNLKVKVSDTGIGIKNEALITLFTNFAKTTEQKNSNIMGTGLGLSITKKLIDLLEGTITVESIYKSGSTFTVSIPHKIS